MEARNLVKIYSGGASPFGVPAAIAHQVRAVDDVSLEIHAGETLGLVGESGSGKSTLGRLILRLIEATSGSVIFDGQNVFDAGTRQMRELRRHMQIIFQDPFGSLNPRMRIREIVSEPWRIHGSGNSSAAGSCAADALVREVSTQNSWSPAELMRAVGMDESALGRFPHEFSGGQRQRIGIARALALRPRLIVCDEPVSALDVSVGAQIVNLLAQLQRELGLTYLFISHSMPVVRYLSSRIAVMHRGKIVEIGATEQIICRPAHPYTQQLLAATPEFAPASPDSRPGT